MKWISHPRPAVVGDTLLNGKRTLLLRITEAGVKLDRLTGAGNADLSIAMAGDMNRDGKIDGTESQTWTAAFTAGDLDGDGIINATDRQILYANYGWRANTAPVAGTPSEIKTHADLSVCASLDSIAHDFEGDQIFWRILNATLCTARLPATVPRAFIRIAGLFLFYPSMDSESVH
jgi:hypothetical protein